MRAAKHSDREAMKESYFMLFTMPDYDSFYPEVIDSKTTENILDYVYGI
jgi:hypothetical protein